MSTSALIALQNLMIKFDNESAFNFIRASNITIGGLITYKFCKKQYSFQVPSETQDKLKNIIMDGKNIVSVTDNSAEVVDLHVPNNSLTTHSIMAPVEENSESNYVLKYIKLTSDTSPATPYVSPYTPEINNNTIYKPAALAAHYIASEPSAPSGSSSSVKSNSSNDSGSNIFFGFCMIGGFSILIFSACVYILSFFLKSN